MKKILSFLFALVITMLLGNITAHSQNIMVNGDLETWVEGVPSGWTITENITQETTTIHGGSSAARHTSATSTKKFQQTISGIIPGDEYTISYWYYDNDPMARTRIWSYWLTGTSTLPDNEEELRPTVYSTDNPAWQLVEFTLVAPATADGFRFEVRVYQENSQSGGYVVYDDFIFGGAGAPLPEPTNYPTDFSAEASGLGINLGWTDATGAQLPYAYLVVASDDEQSLPLPVDGTPVLNDANLSDGSGALNILFGVQEANFSELLSNTTYYFRIYPYTNGGVNINFKTDGTAPAAQATTGSVTIINSENFDADWGDWTPVSVTGDQVWDRNNTYGIGETPCAKMSGYAGGSNENDDWLISAPLNFDNFHNESLSFFTAKNYDGNPLEVKISTDYDGQGDPYTANWTVLNATLSPGAWAWTPSGTIDLSGYDGEEVFIAFQYTSDATESATWEVDNIMITGEEGATIYNVNADNSRIEIYPNPSFGRVTINTNAFSAGNIVKIYSTRGELVYQTELAGQENHLDLGSLSRGIYYVTLCGPQGEVNSTPAKLMIR